MEGTARAGEGLDLGALEAIATVVTSGGGLPDVVRAAARALEASLAVIDRSSSVLAVAARSSGDERALMADGAGVSTHQLQVGGEVVGVLRVRGRAGDPPEALLRLAATYIAGEVERLRAPERAAEAAQADFLRALLERTVTDRGDILARGAEVGIDLAGGAAVVVVRAHHYAPLEEDWRGRVLAAADRAARTSAPGSLAAVLDDHVVVVSPAGSEDAVRRVAQAVARELGSSLHGFTFALGHSRVAADPADLHRAGHEALLAANVCVASEEQGVDVLAFEDTGAYRLLLPAMSDNPAELERFYEETVAPIRAYDEQYETELVLTLETFLDADGNVAGTAQRLFTHRHTVRYRLERVRDLTGHDVGSTDGREKLSLGLKSMRVLGIADPGGPALERGAGGGRVPREPEDR